MHPLTQTRKKEKRTASMHASGDLGGGEPTSPAFSLAKCRNSLVRLDRQGKSRGEKDSKGSKNNGEFHCEKLWVHISNNKMWINWTDDEMICWIERTSLSDLFYEVTFYTSELSRFDRPAYHLMDLLDKPWKLEGNVTGCNCKRKALFRPSRVRFMGAWHSIVFR